MVPAIVTAQHPQGYGPQAVEGQDVLDLLIIGGGVNGCGIARDAAGRGLKVALAEQDDLASWTSSASTKLIHGGLRYLEFYAFRLVREALQERERLLAIAPHIIHPLRFVLPHEPGLRPAWLIRAGLFVYDHLGGRGSLPPARSVSLQTGQDGAPLQKRLRRGFTYYDCSVDDSRLVVLNALDAAERGAAIWTRTRLVSAVRRGAIWEAELERADGHRCIVRTRTLINAAGPWVSKLLRDDLGIAGSEKLRLVQGSHIVTRRLYEGDHAYIFQNGDGRIVFAIPWRDGLTMIGTTDVPFEGDPAAVTISDTEISYLCACASEYFEQPVQPTDVVSTFSGVRPLHDDAAGKASAVSRDYVLDLDGAGGDPPVLSVFGGKITTYRRLAEHALERLSQWLPTAGPDWTANACLPGGDIAHNGTSGPAGKPVRDSGFESGKAKPCKPPAPGAFAAFVLRQQQRYSFAPPELVHRLAGAYGTRMDQVLAQAGCLADLGEDFGDGLYGAEVDYLIASEWAQTVDDVLWRRTRLGLSMPDAGKARLQSYMTRQAPLETHAHA